jgi:serine/threonine protein kinase
MGEVYRARDTKLKRDVAIKILPDEFSLDPDRVNRFMREAEVLASLNHPNIGAIYDLQEAEGSRFLVLEFVEGETLAQRIGRGAIPVEEALSIARGICDALEVAHEKGITHRDLKPANIKLTPDGKVKVLDFGLAKVIEPAPIGAPLADSPTMLSMTATGAGMILGTAAYMAPEQVKGSTVDRRTDIWAFGVVLYEMLTGRPAFDGEDLTEILGRVVTAEPDWSRIPEETPWLIHRLLRRILKKDPRQRLGDIRDARLDIDEALVKPAATRAIPPPRTIRWVWPVLLAVATAIIVLLAIPAVRHLRELPPPAPSEVRLEVTTPPTTDPGSLAISPDGKKLVFVATSEGRPSLWLRNLDSDSTRVLPGADGAWLPFWSPDSRSIGFFADSKLKRIDIDGGSPQDLANASFGNGGTWNNDGVILYSPYPGRPILRVSAKGGPSTAMTRIEASQEGGHREPYFLPDGRHFLYSLYAGDIYVGSIDSTEGKRLIERGRKPIYVDGFLLFVREGTVFAQRFDPGRLELSGNPRPVVEHVHTMDPTVAVATSETGTIVYRIASGNYQSQFVWFDRSGKEIAKVASGPDTAEFVSTPEISPDGSRLALGRVVAGNPDVWLLELARGVLTRFTTDPTNEVFPIWSPDGMYLVFSSTRKGGVHDLYRKAANGAGSEELLLASPTDKAATDWSPNGRYVLYFTWEPKTQNDIWALPLDGDRKPFSVVQTDFEERNAQFSPDGNWIAYQSNESGRSEIYIQPFPGPGPKTRISTGGGAQARWRRDGKELFYVTLDGRLVAAPIRLPSDSASVEAGASVPLMLTHLAVAPVEIIDGAQYVVSPDGQRFLVNTAAQEATAPPISVILNWKAPGK